MKKVYFIVDKEDVTQQLIEQSLQNNAFTIRKSLDGTKWILKYDLNKVPIDLYTLGYPTYTTQSLLSEIDSNPGVWQNDPT